MKIFISMLLWQCVISHSMCFTYTPDAIKFPDSDEQTEHRNDSKESPNNINIRTENDVQINLQNGKNETKKEREALGYSAAANACRRYSKRISDWTFETDFEVQNQFPWMAALGYVSDHQIKFQCNGVVISKKFVLTNVHCAEFLYPPVVVRLGALSLSDMSAIDVPIKEIIRHPYHSSAYRKNDIALIRLAIPIRFSASIRPACLETNVNDVDPSILLTQVGWERMHNEIQEPLKFNLQTMPLSQCNKTYLDYNKDKDLRYLRNGISRSQYCAYDPNYVEGSCGILSGAPIYIFPPNSSLPNIIGILSFGARLHCNDKQPEIFTRIAYYTPWIEAIVWPFDRRKVDEEIRKVTNITTATSTEEMSLFSASKNGNVQAVSLLIQNGANVNEENDGEIALHAAAAAGQEKVARLLIHNGADFTAKNKDGKTASELATEKGFTELARILQQNVAQKACDMYSNLPFVTTRILGGDSVSDSVEFPWMAALGYIDSHLKVSFRCGGTLISEKFVLTAGHCCKDNSRPFIVRLGQVYLNNPDDTKIIENHQIREIINHPGYSVFKKTNDIALIELVKPVFFSEFIRPACLQTYLSDENPNADLTVTGWGIVSPRWRNTSNVLLKANLKTVPLSECNSTVFDYAQSRNWTTFRNGIDQSYYCAGDPNKVSDTCEGDSGGPLQIIRPHFDLSTIVGVISTGLPCGTSWQIPGIYTRVAHFIDWIEAHVWPNGEIATPLINEAALYN